MIGIILFLMFMILLLGGVPIVMKELLRHGLLHGDVMTVTGRTLAENLLLGYKFTEYHTGYRAWSREVLQQLPLGRNSDDFVFDNQMLVQACHFGFRIGEISCPTRYFAEASSISFRRSVRYGFGVLGTALRYRLHHWGVLRYPLLAPLE